MSNTKFNITQFNRFESILANVRKPYRVVREMFFSAIETMKGSLRFGNYWYWIEGSNLTDDIDIDSMVYPYRYDILIRKQFLEMYGKNRARYAENFDALMEDACNSDYYTWFTVIVVPRYNPELQNDQIKLMEAFAERVRASAELYDKVKAYGFNKTYPINPYTAEIIEQPENGSVMPAKFFMGDGCHRLACLMSMGYKKIPKEFVRVRSYGKYQPYNNTSILASFIDDANTWQKQMIVNNDNNKN
ncbi:MAG: hypothetical protein H6936_13110 [Burkholderiales bacterium]|nr:hypothetical protein [Nitrosomonas sp.]MCP5275760.1 hypothetical protein [Burkholderiales bacterium]